MALIKTLALSQEKVDFIMKARKKLGDTATRAQLKEFNPHLGKRSSPVFITKNMAFKTKDRGVYNLAAIDLRKPSDMPENLTHHAPAKKAAAKKAPAAKKAAAKQIAGPKTTTKKAVKKAGKKETGHKEHTKDHAEASSAAATPE